MIRVAAPTQDEVSQPETSLLSFREHTQIAFNLKGVQGPTNCQQKGEHYITS